MWFKPWMIVRVKFWVYNKGTTVKSQAHDKLFHYFVKGHLSIKCHTCTSNLQDNPSITFSKQSMKLV